MFVNVTKNRYNSLMNITFRKFITPDKQLIDGWLKTDELGMQFLSSYVADDFVGLIDFKKRYLWIAYSAATPVGFFDFERESDEKGYFTFYVRPDFRGKGMGYELLTGGLSLPEVKAVRVIEGGVEKDNVSSIKTLEKAGFKYSSTDEDGMLMYQK